MSFIKLQAGESTITAGVETAGSEISKFSGAELRTVVVTFQTHGDQQHDLVNTVLGKGIVAILDLQGQPSYMGSVHQKTLSYQQGSNAQTHTWEVTEKEELVIEKLILNDLEFTPYAFEERLDDSALIITTKLTITAEERDKIENLPPYFSVVRKGISDSPRQMRLGRPLWSQSGDAVKYKLTLVEQCYDDQPAKRRAMFEPETSNTQRMLAGVTEGFEGLLDLLVSKETITDGERVALLEISKDKLWQRSRELHRVDDLDEWEASPE